MRIALLAAGSRGDYQPVLAVAAGLRARGHQVGVTATSDFADEVRAAGFAVEEVRLDAMRIYREQTSARMPGTMAGQIALLEEFAREAADPIATTMREVWPRYDAVVSTALTLSWAAALGAVDPRPHVTMLFVPALPTGWGDASMLSVEPGWSGRNLRAGWAAVGAGARLTGSALSALGPGMTRRQRVRAARLLVTTPTVVAHSRQVVAPRRVSGRQVRVVGYPFRELPPGSALDARLEAFLGAGPAPVYAGFGSQGVGATRAALRHTVQAAVGAGHRVVALRGTGLEEDGWGGGVCFVDGAPHELLLPRCRAVVHHGGAGTTAQALRSGVTQVVVPFTLDQPFFGRRVEEIGVAGPAVPVQRATRDRIAASLALAQRPVVRERAAEVGRLVAAEDGVRGMVDVVEQTLSRSG